MAHAGEAERLNPEGEIAWAKDHVGKTGWYTPGGEWQESIDNNGIGWCARFVANAYMTEGAGGNAKDLKNYNGCIFHPGDSYWNAPKGALLFFDLTEWGHVGLYIGDGKVIHAGYSDVVLESDVSDIGNYSGWGYPPPNTWEGRPDPIPPPPSVNLNEPKLLSRSSLELSWSKVPDEYEHFKSYEIRRATHSIITRENSDLVAEITDRAIVSYQDLNLTPETTYYYKVFVVNTADQASESNEVKMLTAILQYEDDDLVLQIRRYVYQGWKDILSYGSELNLLFPYDQTYYLNIEWHDLESDEWFFEFQPPPGSSFQGQHIEVSHWRTAGESYDPIGNSSHGRHLYRQNGEYDTSIGQFKYDKLHFTIRDSSLQIVESMMFDILFPRDGEWRYYKYKDRFISQPPAVIINPFPDDITETTIPTITGKVEDPDDPIMSIEYQIDGTEGEWTYLDTLDITSGWLGISKEIEFSFDTPELAYGGHTIYIRATDKAGNKTVSEYSFTLWQRIFEDQASGNAFRINPDIGKLEFVTEEGSIFKAQDIEIKSKGPVLIIQYRSDEFDLVAVYNPLVDFCSARLSTPSGSYLVFDPPGFD